MSVSGGRFVRFDPGICFNLDESADCLYSSADFGTKVAWERAPRRGRGCHFVGEHGCGQVHSLPKDVLKGVGKFKDEGCSIL